MSTFLNYLLGVILLGAVQNLALYWFVQFFGAHTEATLIFFMAESGYIGCFLMYWLICRLDKEKSYD